jgi:broad specificity phosphatase PhoE
METPMRTANPDALWLVRHGQSLGNVARDAAHEADLERLELTDRDMDVPLSPVGVDQAAGFGRWLAAEPASSRPDVIITSPYRRAVETAETIAAAAGLDGITIRLDERLRERELGVLDLLTRRGVEAQFPLEAERRARLGKFYHRPPGGESWVDVGLRLRSWRDSMAREHDRQRLLVVAHEVVIVMMRYLIEELTEEQALRLSSDEPLANCSLTSFDADTDGSLVLRTAGWTVPVAESGAAVTDEPDAAVATRG